ncbi:(2Fe-2S)-binding protein [Peptostreptococcaceae bacterium OttesenSCG-928-C18]|nr:(2Fe-2S)-binding protein [Peptostreptococcaceae bacterium OttesenSCG-928-C18]
MENKEKLIMDKLTKVCTCKSITRHTIKKVIAKGHDSLEEVREKTGAGTGYCKGKNCTEQIQELIENYWEEK